VQKSAAMFVLIEASKLRTDDKFMLYKPRTRNEAKFKNQLSSVITKGIKDFYRPRIDPSFTDDGKGICYIPGRKPAVGMTCNWWREKAIEFDKERKSRLGTRSEYIAFIGVLMKQLVSVGWDVEIVWRIFCNDSLRLGHYYNEQADARGELELTGSLRVRQFFDLVNTYKILTEDDSIFIRYWLAGGCCDVISYLVPITSLEQASGVDYVKREFGVGWLVLEK